jgi:hypothetical protein
MIHKKKICLAAAWVAFTLGAGGTQAASLLPKTSDRLVVESTPPGAEIWIMGKHEGVTPMVLPIKKVFPEQFKSDEIGLYGRVRLVKPGCESVTLPVSNDALANGMKVKLKCAEVVPAVGVTPAASPYGAAPGSSASALVPAAPTPALPLSVKERLQQLQDLRRDGLITEDEYQSVRKRILDSL